MAVFISEELIEKVGERLDIVEIISQYIPLRKTGKNYKALCPFHEEKTPSFMVSSEKQLFHCFGCGIGGNAFNFLMKWEKISFPEAVKILGGKVGISISTSDKDKKGGVIKEELYQTNEIVAEIFRQELRKRKSVQDYLKKRGFTREIIEKFGLGWAPSSNDFLKLVQAKEISLKDLRKLKLVAPSQRGEEWYSWFQRRVIFPIFNPEGRICGFGGRVLDKSLPKYLNSPESLIFNKGRVLYGLNLSKEGIRKEEEIILVEGYTDVIALYEAGIKNVVASMGTSLTFSQARLIKRYADRVFIAYDQDKAGVAATLRGIDLLLEAGVRVEIISMPEGVDPADIVKKEGEASFVARKEKATSYFDYRLNLAINANPSLEYEDKIEVVNALFPTLKKVKDSIRLGELIRKLSQRLDLDEEMLRIEFGKFRDKKRGVFSRPEFLKVKDAQQKAEKTLLQLMLSEEAIIKIVEENGNIDDFTNSSYKRIAEETVALSKEGKVSSLELINRLKEENLSSLISSFSLANPPFEEEDKERIAFDLIKSLKKNKARRRIEKLRKSIKESEEKGEEEKLEKWLNELTRLKKTIMLR